MIVKIHRVAKKDNAPVAYTVKVNGRKYPKGVGNFYFPEDRSSLTAISMALYDAGFMAKDIRNANDLGRLHVISKRKVSIK
tara:strand:- start:1235 stop:1477 length:243 start_codon:yes stop_codon:yes gene_type:complete